jgi:mannosyltransferase OCH1-like enzyme
VSGTLQTLAPSSPLRIPLTTYHNYCYLIQRVDALKYFILHHYGGVYMDLDVACRRPLDPLLHSPAWFPEASPLGVNNDLMAARPGHVIFEKLIKGLPASDRNWGSPYLTFFWLTGPEYVSGVLRTWVEMRVRRKDGELVGCRRTMVTDVWIARRISMSFSCYRSIITRRSTRSSATVLEERSMAQTSRLCCDSSRDRGFHSLSFSRSGLQ